MTLDLKDRGLLFVLLEGPRSTPYLLVSHTFKSSAKSPLDEIIYFRTLTGKANVDFASLPILVRFRDINDPKTVERVDPNNLSATFGPGVRLVRAWIEITKDPVTSGIQNILPPWFNDQRLRGATLDGSTSMFRSAGAPIVGRLGTDVFSWRVIK